MLYAHEKAHLLWNIEVRPKTKCLAVSSSSVSLLSPVSEMVSLPGPCLPRTDVFGGGVVTGVKV